MAAITENLSNLNVDNEDVKMHRYGVNVTGVKQVLKSKVSTLPQADERDVKKLLEKYKDSIEKLKTNCKDILSLNGNDPGIDLIYDDIFILRYVLSKKNNLKKAEEAIRVCCKWRADPEIREQVLKPVADNTWTEAPVYQSFCKHMCFGVLGSQVDGGCLFYLRDGLGFPNTVFESLKRDEFLKIGFQSREYIYRWCDYETRRLGRLVKAMFIFGFPGDNLKNALNTINYALSLPITYLQFSVFTPYPGTPLFKSYEDQLVSQKLEDYNQYNLVFKHKYLDSHKVNELKSLAYSRFYLRPKSIPFNTSLWFFGLNSKFIS